MTEKLFEPLNRRISRNNTNFQTTLNDHLNHLLDEKTLASNLKYYQIIVAEYFKLGLSKGLFLNQHMGFGKTIGSYHMIALMLKENPALKVLVIAPRALINNFKTSSKKYEELTGNSIPPSKINFIKLSHTIEKQVAKTDPDAEIDPFNLDEKADQITELDNLNNYLIVIDEAHLFCRRISHGSASMIKFYDMMNTSNCRIIMLSGSLIATSPFELSPIINLLSGELLMPETEEEFNSVFMDWPRNLIKNKAIFQNRCYGLFSRMKPEYLKGKDKEMYPEELPTEVRSVAMNSKQMDQYISARDKEIKQEKSKIMNESRKSKNVNRFQADAINSGSYRTRSRQISNCVTNEKIEELYKSKDYTQQDLIDECFNMSLTDMTIPKLEEVLKIMKSRPNEKGVIYSQFVAVGGAATIAAFLAKSGCTEVLSTMERVDRVEESQRIPYSFARINGSLSQEEQSALVDRYCKPDNDDGSVITVLIIGLEQTMGLDLTSGRYAIMYEPYWTDFIRDQFKYRIIRYGSHMTLPPEKRNTQMYILLSIYPSDSGIDREDSYWGKTTDQHIYDKMTNNKILMDSFKSAIDEVSIECTLVKRFGDDSHSCRNCSPNDMPLYTTGNPKDAIANDIKMGNTCTLAEIEQIEVTEVILKTESGDQKFYVEHSDSNVYGFLLYIESESGSFIPVPVKSILYRQMKEYLRTTDFFKK